MTKRICCYLFGIVVLFSFQGVENVYSKMKGKKNVKIIISSPAFKHGGMIPIEYTCDGKDISPKLEWGKVAGGTKSIALICDDPDAPMKTWIHWVLFNLPPETRGLQKDVPPVKTLDNGARNGINDFRKLGYGGPCPPTETHRYFFKIYALDIQIDLPAGATKAQLMDAMEGHILSEGQLIGKYKR
ncbi:MAG TPA: YbhB/YbcL family Raf kinase inhibitor-like protein [Desulfobacteraceae bacterium]|nr:YbhB/YbcL family Raf kinase inhibitor-like protein [Desulfobacteraceae bacterium]